MIAAVPFLVEAVTSVVEAHRQTSNSEVVEAWAIAMIIVFLILLWKDPNDYSPC